MDNYNVREAYLNKVTENAAIEYLALKAFDRKQKRESFLTDCIVLGSLSTLLIFTVWASIGAIL
tara:strand:+ start:4954 stop:5145 length:192 start_codon:yes stop_codon:yes gene_type:complete